MSAIDDGGAAFPRFSAKPTPGGGIHYDVSGGMSLRDFFAGQAMQGMLAYGDTKNRSGDYIGAEAYRIADAMLKARTA